MKPEIDLTPAEERQLARVLDTWQTYPTSPGLAQAILAKARPKAPAFTWSWPRMATLAAAACLGLVVGWWMDGMESYATSLEPGFDALYFEGDPIEGDIL
ncbi:MAG: hypothetical protein FJX54_00210 [Alphaproteobacteria bacterium]|nr:hypothetical protein [Alphaproteobacteria bacterium]